MAIIDYDTEYRIACNRWWKHPKGNIRTWYRYIKAPTDLKWENHDAQGKVVCTDEQARRIRLLCGPHYETIIKAWYVNNPLPEETR